MTRHRSLDAIAAAIATLGGLAALGTPAYADPPPVDNAKLVLVLDASSSMLEADASGGTRIDAARAALNQVIGDLAPTEQVGFRVFGATIAGVETPGACEDTQLLVPIGTDNRDALAAAVSQYAPYGETPIGYALQAAAGDVGTEGQRSILLVTDGEANCGPEPCQVARDIASGDINLTINTVGLNVGPEARTQLQCIADAGHGTYFDAQDSATLIAAMDRLATRAFRPFAVAGTPVVGTPTPDGAPELVAGQYTDMVGAVDEPRHYLVRRTLAGSSLHVGFTAIPGHDATYGQVGLRLESLDGTDCSAAYPTSYGDAWTIMAGQADYWTAPDDSGDPCLDDELLMLTVTMTDWGDEVAGTPFELLVQEEPRLAPGAVLPEGASADQTQWQPMTVDGAGGAAVGGSSFNDAPVLAPGSYTTDILPGETVLFRVPLAWGQSLQAEADFATPSPALAAAYDVGQGVKMTVISPARGDVTEVSLPGTGLMYSTNLLEAAPTVVASATAPIRWWNRNEVNAPQHANVAGDYYIAITVAPDGDGESYIIPFTFTVGVFGTAGEGAPTYDETPIGAPTGTDPADVSAAPATVAASIPDSVNSIVSSTPADGDVLAAPPSEIVVNFADPIGDGSSAVMVCDTDPFGGLGPAAVSNQNRTISITLTEPPAGQCVLTFTLTSPDGSVNGRPQMQFTVS